MTTYRLTHLPSGEAHTFNADNARELALGIVNCSFTTTLPGEFGDTPVRPLFSTRKALIEQIDAGEAQATQGSWRLEEARA